ncbi:DUF2993 domain-containing protein [Streptomyces echinoruber]|uniref:DUF2993 domain-containing protein n=1 Tax=Streptomyces echinoruber TaxID=68898 RepID=A0A918RTK2_9ACTN|nr:DUF2993 domain-containing protein [Streptomyces echinoruber]GHA09314.1 hypothetical protein GCM10010389_55530 [Streptomyces echinoruber]
MRALRILLIVVVILGGLFVAADRLAVHFAEGEVADRLKARENLATTPDVSIEGFPFLTQVVGRKLDDVEVGIGSYQATAGTGGRRIRIDDLHASMKGVSFSGDYGSATAATATGSATVSYAELLRAVKPQETEIMPNVTAQVTGLSYGGGGKVKVTVKVTAPQVTVPPVAVLGSVTVVDGDTVRIKADRLPDVGLLRLAANRVRAVTDFQQKIDGLPGGIRLQKVQAAKDGVDIAVTGSDVRLAG